MNSEFLVESSTNIRNIRNLHRQFEIQMLVENHKCRCATFASGSTNDLTPPMCELFGPLERSNCPINPNPLSLALDIVDFFRPPSAAIGPPCFIPNVGFSPSPPVLPLFDQLRYPGVPKRFSDATHCVPIGRSDY